MEWSEHMECTADKLNISNVLVEKSGGKIHSEDQSVDVTIILKYVLKRKVLAYGQNLILDRSQRRYPDNMTGYFVV
jgi:hypothetical protein